MKSYIMIEHGEKTCASEPGKFCKFLGHKSFGVVPVCMLFNTETLYEEDGWTLRSNTCLRTLKVDGKE